MKIICEKEKIIKALNSVTKAVASKPNNPILEGILIQTNNNELIKIINNIGTAILIMVITILTILITCNTSGLSHILNIFILTPLLF